MSILIAFLSTLTNMRVCRQVEAGEFRLPPCPCREVGPQQAGQGAEKFRKLPLFSPFLGKTRLWRAFSRKEDSLLL